MFELSHLNREIFIYVESIDISNKTLLTDFIESNNFSRFFEILGLEFPIDGPTMLLFKNYEYRKREGSIYSLGISTIDRLRQEERVTLIEDSFIVRAEIDLKGIKQDILGSSVSHIFLEEKYFFTYRFHLESAYGSSFQLPNKGRTRLIIKDVGQGSWTEIEVDKKLTLIFDAGTYYSTKASKVTSMYGNRDSSYQTDCPGLIISHWDVDHYHFLKVMTDATISSLKFILCRNFTPSLMSRVIFSRLAKLNKNLISISADIRTVSVKETPLFPYYDNKRFTIFNSGYSRSRNKNGLSLLIRTATKSVLLTGDQHYGQFDHFVIPSYLNYGHRHYLIVPHHGGNAGSYNFNLQQKVKKGDAIISVGSNTYGHPLPSILKCLRAASFNIRRTDIVGRDIDIHL
ncbi:hypothetical protein GO495_29815 [Chitinophaga oryziterrae]|uniref:Metallo-beta-lactamase domain-containing protein n=1 Tax=Chitinophaga oryziterrae TaxID=1031224 RepID=A0A6N8JKC6_9BACT|nr:hypothetical protein [Chitinophaga oryziterrae]MVT44826.1 hypothetical protein [Chitinophaga oryziterrae]